MNPKLKSGIKALLFLTIGLILLYVVYNSLSADEKHKTFEAIKQANYFWLAISMSLCLLAHVSRAIRWGILLHPLNHYPKIYNSFFAVMIGYLANYAFPRLGEATRCGILSKYEKVPFAESLGTVIVERIIDVICLFIVFTLTLFLQFDKIYELADKFVFSGMRTKFTAMVKQPVKLVILAVVVVVIVSIFFYFRKKIASLFNKKFTSIITGFIDGIASIKNVKRPFLFIAHTIFIWLMYYASLHVSFLCFSETSHLGIGPALAVMAIGTIGVIFTPGGTGAYQFLVTTVLTTAYFISQPTAFALSWVVWSSQLLLSLSIGLISLLLLPILNNKTNDQAPIRTIEVIK